MHHILPRSCRCPVLQLDQCLPHIPRAPPAQGLQHADPSSQTFRHCNCTFQGPVLRICGEHVTSERYGHQQVLLCISISCICNVQLHDQHKQQHAQPCGCWEYSLEIFGGALQWKLQQSHWQPKRTQLLASPDCAWHWCFASLSRNSGLAFWKLESAAKKQLRNGEHEKSGLYEYVTWEMHKNVCQPLT